MPEPSSQQTAEPVRCPWCGEAPDYQHYHDHEWGVPLKDDQRLFEKMVLEGFQSGLSWITILRKREAFREVFAQFDIDKVATFSDADIDRLVLDARIVRHRGKITSAVNNAKQVQGLRKEFGSLAKFIWSFEPSKHPRLSDLSQAQAQISESAAMSKELRKRGFSFVGPTTMYAMMQSAGLVNDHLETCFRFTEIEKLRQSFKRPI